MLNIINYQRNTNRNYSEVTTSHQSERSSSKSLQVSNAGEGVETRELSHTVGRKVSWCEWKWKSLSRVRLFVIPWTIQSMEFSRPQYWSGLAFPFSRGSFQPRDRTQVSRVVGRRFTIWATREASPLKTWLKWSMRTSPGLSVSAAVSRWHPGPFNASSKDAKSLMHLSASPTAWLSVFFHMTVPCLMKSCLAMWI